jgi:hypothetical protein
MRSKPTARRLFRRFRLQFKKDLNLQNLTGADRVLIDQAALLALRARQMRDDILDGAKPVSDEDLVRNVNACLRAVAGLRTHKGRDADAGDALQAEAERARARPGSDLDPIEIYLAEKREREEREKADGEE